MGWEWDIDGSCWGLEIYVALVSCRRFRSIGPLYRSQGWAELGHGYRGVHRTVPDVWGRRITHSGDMLLSVSHRLEEVGMDRRSNSVS